MDRIEFLSIQEVIEANETARFLSSINRISSRFARRGFHSVRRCEREKVMKINLAEEKSQSRIKNLGLRGTGEKENSRCARFRLGPR